MTTPSKNTDTRIKIYTAPEMLRSGGEHLPMEYPHLYQIQAGEWRISYAVEHNRLAILVLEVLGPDGQPRKDPVSENLTQKMKIKLLDLPEVKASQTMPPEEIGKKLKIKLLDLADELGPRPAGKRGGASRIKFTGPAKPAERSRKITLVDTPASETEQDIDDAAEAEIISERKITPLDSPSM